MMKQLIPIYGLEMEEVLTMRLRYGLREKESIFKALPGAARLTVDGDVDIEAPSGIVVDRGEAAVGGGKIDSKGEAAVSVNAKSKFYMNAGVDTEGNVTVAHPERNVQVLGDIRSKQNSSVFIGLGNSQSVLKGLFTTDLHTWPYNE